MNSYHIEETKPPPSASSQSSSDDDKGPTIPMPTAAYQMLLARVGGLKHIKWPITV